MGHQILEHNLVGGWTWNKLTSQGNYDVEFDYRIFTSSRAPTHYPLSQEDWKMEGFLMLSHT